MTPHPLDEWHQNVDERLDNQSGRLAEVEERLIQHGTRLDALEDDHGSVRLLVTTITELGHRVKDMADGVDMIAETAVRKVMDQLRQDRRDGWQHRLTLVGTGAGTTATALGILRLFHLV